MGRLSELENERIEEHLLVCHPCQDLLTETDEFIGVARAATHELSLKPHPTSELAESQSEAQSEKWWRKLFSIPTPMVAAAAFAVIAFFVFIPRGSQVSTVELQTLRGPEAPVVAPANSSLNLRLSLRGLESQGPLRVEIANASDQIVETMGAERADGLAIAKANALATGLYWVRLYSGDELLREYGLNVR